MHIPWWQSIRWRLALASGLLALLTTSVLALTTILVTNYYYGTDQKKELSSFASEKAEIIGITYMHQTRKDLVSAAKYAVTHGNDPTNRSQPMTIVLGRVGYIPVYPSLSVINKVESSKTKAVQIAVATSLLEFINTSVQPGDLARFTTAINKAHRGIATDDYFGQQGPVRVPQAFSVRPIFSDVQKEGPASPVVVGVLIATTRTNTVPSFVLAVGVAVAIASLIIAALAALAAILFSQTITRPLSHMTRASRVLASGDYDARVHTQAPGELGELAHTFNEMATQLKKDVEALRQQEIERRELIMNITHDLATPLTAIAGLGEALVDGVNQSRDDYEATGRIIIRETLRLHRLVKDLHVMSKVEAGALHPATKPIRLAALVDEVFAFMASEFERRQIEPDNTIPFGLPLVQADPDMLTRVFTNLCNNSLRHTPTGGAITVAAVQQGTMLHISVTDTGEGIPEEALQRIFERFYRVDSSRQSSTGGSGLGLAIVRAIISAHGGKIWAENASQGGASIHFTLPVSAASPRPEQIPATETRSLLAQRRTIRSPRLAPLEGEPTIKLLKGSKSSHQP